MSSYRNRLLSGLAPADRRSIAPHLKLVSLALRQPIEEPNKRIGRVYFVEAGIVSVVAVGRFGATIEIGLVGREGMTGAAVVLGDRQSPNSSFVQAAGQAYEIRTDTLRKLMDESAALHGRLLKYVHIFMIQTAQTAVANGRASIEARLARWILMAHDRLDEDRLPLTHEFLALMLGVRRAGVTDAVNGLAGTGMIGAARGEIRVIDRGDLEQRAGESYGVAESEYRRLIG